MFKLFNITEQTFLKLFILKNIFLVKIIFFQCIIKSDFK